MDFEVISPYCGIYREENTVNDGFQTVEEYEKARLEIIREGG